MTHPLEAFRKEQTPPLNQRQLADLLGVSTAAVSRWESGERRIDEDLLRNIQRKTGIHPGKLRPDLAKLFKKLPEHVSQCGQ